MREREFIDQLSELVAVPSISTDLDNCRKVVDVVERYLCAGVKVERWENQGVQMLLAGNGDLYKPDIAYIAHADVVAGEPDLFQMKIEGDRLSGRGVSDMKFSIPIGIALLSKVIENKSSLNFTLVISTDEEVGGKNGVKNLAEERGFNPASVIVPDWGDNFVFTHKSKGVSSMRIDSTGAAAHASEIWKGKNANEALVRLISRLLDRYSDNNRHQTWQTTMNIGIWNGGVASNQVCDEAYVRLDFRFPETRTAEEIFDEVRAEAAGVDKDLRVTPVVRAMPTAVDMSNPIVIKFIEAFKKSVGREISHEGGTGATDARHFAGSGIPLLVIKPDGGAVHSVDEWISLSACMKYYEALEDFVGNYATK